MSFIPIPFGQQVHMTARQMDTHRIDPYGNSDLPCYADSIFALNYRSASRVFDGRKWTERSVIYLVTRINRSILDFSSSPQKNLSKEETRALRIDMVSGRSLNPDLNSYVFEVKKLDDNRFSITKKNVN